MKDKMGVVVARPEGAVPLDGAVIGALKDAGSAIESYTAGTTAGLEDQRKAIPDLEAKAAAAQAKLGPAQASPPLPPARLLPSPPAFSPPRPHFSLPTLPPSPTRLGIVASEDGAWRWPGSQRPPPPSRP
jgi:hypothetical protein